MELDHKYPQVLIIMKDTKVQTLGAVAGAWPVAWVRGRLLFACATLIDGLGHATRSATQLMLATSHRLAA